MSVGARVAVGALRAYQWTLRPVIGAHCRFFPSCSDYAIEAFRTHGMARGGGLAAWRIVRCNPWCDGGYDPVPPPVTPPHVVPPPVAPIGRPTER